MQKNKIQNNNGHHANKSMKVLAVHCFYVYYAKTILLIVQTLSDLRTETYVACIIKISINISAKLFSIKRTLVKICIAYNT